MTRAFDLVLFGATGFTGGLTADYLARHAPAGCRWALAGRDHGKLDAVRQRLAAVDPAHADLPLLTADVIDAASLRELAESTRVLATTVGPYLSFGEPLVAACAEAGTGYLDLTGEAEFVDRMYLRHNETALRTGARLVHSCGFESIPYDLGAYFTVCQLPEGVPVRLRGYVTVSGTFSGGTLHSAINAMSRLGPMNRAARARRAVEPRPAGRRVRGIAGLPGRDRDVGAWVLPAPTIDPLVVLRSARALDRYGPDFSYSHYVAVDRLPTALGLAGGAGAAVALAQVPATRRWLLDRRAAGDGPSQRRRERSWFRVRFVGEGGGKRVVTEMSGGDPGYGETAKMLAEAALCLAFDDVPASAGQVTPAVAMGDPLLDRLARADLPVRVLGRV